MEKGFLKMTCGGRRYNCETINMGGSQSAHRDPEAPGDGLVPVNDLSIGWKVPSVRRTPAGGFLGHIVQALDLHDHHLHSETVKVLEDSVLDLEVLELGFRGYISGQGRDGLEGLVLDQLHLESGQESGGDSGLSTTVQVVGVQDMLVLCVLEQFLDSGGHLPGKRVRCHCVYLLMNTKRMIELKRKESIRVVFPHLPG